MVLYNTIGNHYILDCFVLDMEKRSRKRRKTEPRPDREEYLQVGTATERRL